MIVGHNLYLDSAGWVFCFHTFGFGWVGAHFGGDHSTNIIWHGMGGIRAWKLFFNTSIEITTYLTSFEILLDE